MDSESGIFSMTFDQSGSRLITTEADKTIKIYKEDDTAVRMIIKYTIRTLMGRNKSDVDMWTFQVFRMCLILLAKSAVLGFQDFLKVSLAKI
jgi:WD40 repeat protein